MEDSIEKKRVLRIYKYLIAIICVSPLFEVWSFIPSTVLRLTELICLIGALHTLFLLHKSHSLIVNYKWIFILFFIYCAFIVVRGDWSSGIKYNVLLIINPFNTLVYILPFLILFLPNRQYLPDILKIFYNASLIVIPIWLLNINNLVQDLWDGENIGAYLPFFSAFLLGTIKMQTKQQKFLTICIWGIYFLLMLLNARRNVCFSLALYAIIACFFYMRKSSLARFWVIFAGIILSFGVVNRWEELTKDTFHRMYQRGTEDTREGVEDWFLMDMMAQPTETWIIGKGMTGSYYQPMNIDDERETAERPGIETGYLHLILKGGVLLVLFIVTFMVMAIIKGFQSPDWNIKYIACTLLPYIINIYIANPVGIFGVRSILFWFCVSVCLQCYDTIYDEDLDSNLSEIENI